MSYPNLKIKEHLSPDEVKKRYQQCKDGVEKTHWQVIWLLYRTEKPLKTSEVASIIGYSADWVRKIANRYNKLGPDGLCDARKGNGQELLITNEKLVLLEKCLETKPDDGGLWSGPKVAKWIEKECGIKVSNVTGWSYLVKLDFSLQIPRPKHKQSATKEEQADYKKNSKMTPKKSKKKIQAKS